MLACAGLLSWVSTSLADPQYKLTVGTHHAFHRVELVSQDHQQVSREEYELRLWTLAQANTGTLVLITQHPTANTPGDVTGLLAIVSPNGRRHWPPALVNHVDEQIELLDLLPILPGPVQQQSDWTSAADLFHRTQHCRGSGSNPLRVEFELHDPVLAHFGMAPSRTGHYEFNVAAGRLERLESTETDPTTNQTRQVIITHRSSRQFTSSWSTRRAAEAERYLRTHSRADNIMHEIFNNPHTLDAGLDRLQRLWSGFLADLDSEAGSPFRLLARAQRNLNDTERRQLRQRLEIGRAWAGNPARTWTLSTPTGDTVTSETLRNGPVIECFWSSQSPWSIRALGPFLRLQDGQTGRRVPVLCYNMNVHLTQALAAIAHAPAELTHIVAGPLQMAEHLPELPLVRVLDADGVTREFWVGWQADYPAARERAQELLPAP